MFGWELPADDPMNQNLFTDVSCYLLTNTEGFAMFVCFRRTALVFARFTGKSSIVKNPRVKRFFEKSMEKNLQVMARDSPEKGGLESLLGVQVGRRVSYVRCQC